LRRQPVQSRSAERVDRILASAAELLDETGYQAMTTTAIAGRARVAVGTLYQFFPDKRAVVQALTARNLDRFLAEVRAGLAGVTDWWDATETIIDLYLRMHREVPGFAAVHFGDVVDTHLLDPERTNNAVIVDALAGAFDRHVEVPDDELRLALTVANEAADALLKLAFARDRRGDERIVAETKYLLRCYLRARFGPAGPPGQPNERPSPR
jgi:AcrR family transcriptional regulator